jgi:hypothetical protein
LNVGREEAQKVLRSRLPRLNERMFLHLWATFYTIKERMDDVFNAASADPLPQHPMISGDIYTRLASLPTYPLGRSTATGPPSGARPPDPFCAPAPGSAQAMGTGEVSVESAWTVRKPGSAD